MMRPPAIRAGAGGLAVAVLAIIAMLVVPLPPPLLDGLLALDVFGASAVLVVALSVQDPLELSAFPSLLLVATLFRLSLDVSATRLILTQGDIAGGVGSVIPAFGQFVMRGNIVVGLLLFVILIVVQLVVVTNGAQRVAEVAARFTLDGMPGKQMAIDADLHAGLIDASGARARRRAVQAEADFYGAMDGAGKFVRGDALAAIIIVSINLIAGIAIGVMAKHLDVAGATQTFALLSIGNALATTLPAFLLSTAMGVMVTRAASDVGLGSDLARQLLAHPSALRTVGGAMVLLALVPGLPHAAFGLLGVAGFAGGNYAAKERDRRVLSRQAEDAQRKRVLERKPESAVALLGVDHLAIDVGEALLPLLDEPAGSALLARISNLRRALALELGLVIPAVRVRDDLRLPPRGFAIRVRDRVVAQAQLHPNRALAIGPPTALGGLTGDAAKDPVTGASALWISPQTDAVGGEVDAPAGTIVVDPVAVLTSKLGSVARAHAPALLGRQEVQVLLDHVRRTHPAAVKGVVPELVGLGVLQRVLQHLVRESVSIRDIVAILETIADEAEWTKDPAVIGEAARRRLAPAICASLADPNGSIHVHALDNELEAALASATVATDRGPMLGLDVPAAQRLAEKLAAWRAKAATGVRPSSAHSRCVCRWRALPKAATPLSPWSAWPKSSRDIWSLCKEL
ncbi:MAG: FHIPEP family type III secretion protein [Candidatus Eremiobacteraeota bacterium]|nr:FHIPEP family type III secretion protein [Candidatus Eremiobacteraeota bacterium]MBC5827317.1 FHIPEP family type III secretion protein [Candidatus Eremiobacteraeota bacterium]